MDDYISILGINIKCLTLEKAQEYIEEYLNNDVLNTMCIVTKEMLVYAQENQDYREILEGMDMHVIVDKDIYSAAGVTDEIMLQTAAQQQIFRSFIDIASKEKKSFFLITQTQEETEEFSQLIREEFPGLIKKGAAAIEQCGSEGEEIVNAINGVLPDIVFSLMDQPMSAYFIGEHACKIGAKVWFGFQAGNMKKENGEEGWLSRFIGRTVFHRRVQQYNNMYEE